MLENNFIFAWNSNLTRLMYFYLVNLITHLRVWVWGGGHGPGGRCSGPSQVLGGDPPKRAGARRFLSVDAEHRAAVLI